jgi:hypothetical protein
MPRTMLAERVQWGVETVEGTGVAADKLMHSMGVDLDPDANIDLYRPMGLTWPSVSNLLSEAAAGSLEGRPDYNEIIYPLNSVLGTGVITTPGGGTNSRTHTFTPGNSGVDAAKSFTIEVGDAGGLAEKVVGARVTSFNFHAGFDAIDIGGSLIARAIQTGITITAAPTGIVEATVQPNHLAVYLDTTSGGLGSTKLTELYDVNLSIGDRWGLYYVLDRAVAPGPKASVMTEPSSDCSIQLQADSAGNALFTAMRDGSIRYLRVEAIGPIIEAAITYKILWDCAVKISGNPSYDDVQGIKAITWPLSFVSDTVWGKPMVVAVTNAVTAL